jgi:hypothetical protein
LTAARASDVEDDREGDTVNTAQRLVVGVGVLALLAMCAYLPLVHTKAAGYGQTKWAYGWLWEHGSIDTARLGIQCLLVAGVTGLLAYGLRPAAIQAMANRKNLAIQAMANRKNLAIQAMAKRKKLLLVSVVVILTGGAVCVFWGADLCWWWHSLPPKQVSKISVKETLTLQVRDSMILEPQQRTLVVTNGSGEALQAISIRIYYGVPVPSPPEGLTDEQMMESSARGPVLAPSTHDRLPCFVSPGGVTMVTLGIEHEYRPALRVEVVGAWRQ